MKAFIEAKNVCLDLAYEVQGAEKSARTGFLSALSFNKTNYASVLNDVSFRAEEGDRVGIMGFNGAGKTTLLRVLNGALLPKSGVVEKKGSLQSLLTTTLGFNEHATLSENVILRGTAMGLRYKQIQAAMGTILDFAELSDKANRRLNTLSAGQRMRLGFAISTAVQPDILLMDEWIGAGDAVFVKKAKQRMLDRFNGSKISIIASHSAGMLRSLCNKALVLDASTVKYYGEINEGLKIYEDLIEEARAKEGESTPADFSLLYGQVLGAVDQIIFGDEGVIIKGWAATEKKEEVAVIEVEFPSKKYLVEDIERFERRDVNLFLGRRNGKFGFQILVPFQIDQSELQDIKKLARQMSVKTADEQRVFGEKMSISAGALVMRQE